MKRKIPSDAFDYYVSLGLSRSYQAVADRYEVSKRAVTSCARREAWQRRIVDLEAKAREASEKKALESIEAMKERHLRTIRFIQGKALEALKQMPIEAAMDAVRALTVTLREERVILGEPSDRTAISIEDTIKREYERWMVTADKGAEAPEETEGDDADILTADESE
jgi:hypothetical protein